MFVFVYPSRAEVAGWYHMPNSSKNEKISDYVGVSDSLHASEKTPKVFHMYRH